MRGRKMTPTAVKELKNNPGMRPPPKNEPKVRKASFREAPDYVKKQKYAEDCWNATLPLLIELGTIANCDLGVFGKYCVADGMHREATLLMSDEGLVYASKTQTGSTIQRKSPYIEIINQQARIVQSFAAEFGLTSSARARLGKTLNDGKDDPLAEFLNDDTSIN